jgi:Protein of unknown function (DUF2924)
MSRVKTAPALPDRRPLDIEIARLRDLDIEGLRNYWRTSFRRRPPAHLSSHLLFRTLAYRLQADQLGDLDRPCQNLLKRSASFANAGQRAVDQRRQNVALRPGTTLAREWKGRMPRVTVLTDGFAWKGKTYPSLSQVAFAITGTRWNGPRFFGLRDKPSKASS